MEGGGTSRGGYKFSRLSQDKPKSQSKSIANNRSQYKEKKIELWLHSRGYWFLGTVWQILKHMYLGYSMKKGAVLWSEQENTKKSMNETDTCQHKKNIHFKIWMRYKNQKINGE